MTEAIPDQVVVCRYYYKHRLMMEMYIKYANRVFEDFQTHFNSRFRFTYG